MTNNDDIAFRDAKIKTLADELWGKENYSLNMTDYANGYAQALEDGAGKPLTDNKDVQFVIDQQKKRIMSFTNGAKNLAKYLYEVDFMAGKHNDLYEDARERYEVRAKEILSTFAKPTKGERRCQLKTK